MLDFVKTDSFLVTSITVVSGKSGVKLSRGKGCLFVCLFVFTQKVVYD
jgi:hypothetical protein